MKLTNLISDSVVEFGREFIHDAAKLLAAHEFVPKRTEAPAAVQRGVHEVVEGEGAVALQQVQGVVQRHAQGECAFRGPGE